MTASRSIMTAPPRPTQRPTTKGKPEMRAWARSVRDAVPAPTRDAAAAAIAAIIDGDHFSALAPRSIVGLYAGMGSELPTRELDERARARGLVVAYPRVVRGERALRFHLATLDDLRVATFNVPEPQISAPTVPASAIALIVVPGLLFTPDGARLGWGAGHYDATLPAVGGRSLGVALREQVVDDLPEDPHDRRVERVVTETGVVRPSQARP